MKHEEKEYGSYPNGISIHKMQMFGELNDACGMQMKSNWSEREHKPITHRYSYFEFYAHDKKWIYLSLDRMQGMWL